MTPSRSIRFLLLLLPVLGPGLVSASPELSAAVAAHEQVSCRKCHFDGAAGRAAAADRQCLKCHQNPAVQRATSGLMAPARTAADGLDFHRRANDRCTDCHAFHEPGAVLTGAGKLDLRGAEQVDRGHCVGCHGAGADRTRLSLAHQQAAELYHGRSGDLVGHSVSRGCLNCHDRNSGSNWGQINGDVYITFDTHRSHPLGMRVIPGSGTRVASRIQRVLDPRLPLFQGRMECLSCHDLTAGTKDLLIPFEDPRNLCLGCHALKPKRTGKDHRLVMDRPVGDVSTAGQGLSGFSGLGGNDPRP